MMGIFKRIRLPDPPWKWNIGKLSQRILALEGVYDVMPEYVSPGRYLVHVWAEIRDDLESRIRDVAYRRPRDVKIDVLLYRRE
ncbi:hypothetical protein [Desulfosporosinus sp. FKA]|uniref:hypothetical protein n=1 Tax=Desulfosporosinus sp. FKA TaxID=1969834 RepID=UPI001554302F|nr:hypothetical protein [Desulfosporosinus sp. FKA]